ncbi:LutC/YkgG family protein [Nocardia lijiangensis]|uniref:LutC/YkgG family protein n=1 Tax=Nocardia lijiangensis TaxID=299618 RepID=UPI000A9781F7|nr:LUD domain-containing protein [Nocardia lijiangensis]
MGDYEPMAAHVNSREDLLRRIRDALVELPDDERVVPVPRANARQTAGPERGELAELVDLFAARLAGHGAQLRRTTGSAIPDQVAAALREHGARSAIAPDGLPGEWLAWWAAEEGHRIVPDSPLATSSELEQVDAVVTTCAAAAADPGILVLDGGEGQSRRPATLAPDCHVCVVRVQQIQPSLPEVMDRLDPRRQTILVGGPSADADAVTPGVHGPRRLIVLVVE